MSNEVVVEGFGLRLLVEPGVELRHTKSGGLRVGGNTIVEMTGAGAKPAEGVDLAAFGVSELDTEDREEAWTISSRGLRCSYPTTLVLRVVEPGAWTFELAPKKGAGMLVLRGPREDWPELEELAQPEQKIIDRNDGKHPWIELEYRLAGEGWRQRHHFVVVDNAPIAMVTAQARSAKRRTLFNSAGDLALSVARS